MMPTRLLLALALLTATLAFAPPAAASDPIACDDRDCLVSVETYVCVTYPCDGIVVCVAHGKVCTNRL